MRQWLMNFMRGRYGIDSFGRFLNAVIMIMLVLSLFRIFWFLYVPSLVLLIYSYFRIFSRNHSARYRENAWYLRKKAQVMGLIRRNGSGKADAAHRIYRCPGCRQKIRVPKGRGMLEITCPRCRRTFRKRT